MFHRTLSILVLALSATAFGSPADSAASPALRSVQLAEEAIRLAPDNVEAYNRLARAWLRRGGEVERGDCYEKAESAARKALALNEKSFSARRLLIESLLGLGRERTALELAEALNRDNRDDLDGYGLIVDAAIALGRYDQAEEAAQWMLDLRPDRVEGLSRAAALRELLGDLEGAADFQNRVFLGTPPDQPEAKAETLGHLARLLRYQGHADEADRVLKEAIQLSPDKPSVLLELAWLRESQGRPDEAVALLRRRVEVSPEPERFYRLGELLRRTGKSEEAAEAFRKFEETALALRDQPRNANLLLALHWAETPSQVAQALELIEKEAANRSDVHTRSVLALLLHAAGRDREALREIEKVLAVGTRDPEILARAAVIRGGDR